MTVFELHNIVYVK